MFESNSSAEIQVWADAWDGDMMGYDEHLEWREIRNIKGMMWGSAKKRAIG